MKKGYIVLVLLLVSIIVISGCAEKPITGMEWFQIGNTQDITKLNPKKSIELEDNKIGWMLSPEEEKDTLMWEKYVVNAARDMGLKQVRLSVDYFDIEKVNWDKTYSKHYIDASHDKMINGLIDNDIEIRYCIVFWDKESPGQQKREDCDKGIEDCYSRFKTEEEIQRYLDYVEFIVTHFKDKVKYYELLNEQQGGLGSQQFVEVEDYINLIKRIVPIIKQADPQAKIVIGAIANLYEPGDYDYLLTILNSDVLPLVGGISFHGLHGISPDYEHSDFYYNYPSILKEIKDTASANGFKGEYFGDELVWRTYENTLESEPWVYSEIAAAKYYARGIITQLGLDVVTGFTELEFDRLQSLKRVIGKTISNLATIMAGAKPINLPIEIQSSAENIKYYTFTLSNRDKLIAIWNDKAAVDDNPGVKADIIFEGLSGKEVVAIDVLNGFTQSLVTEGNAVKGLIVRDYPTILNVRK